MWVWALDEEHLPHYLLPRQCPRVCWKVEDGSASLLGSPAARVIAIEREWSARLLAAGLVVHELAPTGFTLLDRTAGYWVAEQEVKVIGVVNVDDCFAALAQHDVELRLTPSLWPYLDAVTAGVCEFSGIRLRNARPRGTS